ncbi:DNA polymerase phi-domain-containing protein [Sporodiniella umbellata]|nr:DNA polymerase phi-domain-containing protein [Sporodiniella umbellata]
MGALSVNSPLKYIFVGSVICCTLLWLLVYQERSKTLLIPEYQRRPLCTPETFNIGEWIHYPSNDKNTALKAGYHCIKKKFAHRCFNRASAIERFRAQKILNYKWEPSQCRLLPLKTDILAKHLIKNPVLFVGDSITQLQFESLSCLLGETFFKRVPTLNGGNLKLRVEEIGNNSTTAMAYIRSDYLIRLDDFKIMESFDEAGTILGSGENHPWIHAIEHFKYVIINTAPHWHISSIWGPHKSEQELLSAYKTAMTKIYKRLKKSLLPHQIVWVRNTPYGHAQCSKITSPQLSPTEPSGQPGEYDWHLFKQFDAIWKELIGSDSQFRIFDFFFFIHFVIMATTTLQLYWDLASFDPIARQTAAKSLIETLANFQKAHEETLKEKDVVDSEEKLDILCASDVSYAVRRLIRGLSSSRQGARQGFSLALTELLAVVDLISVGLVLDLLFKWTEITGSMKGDEVRDMLFGRLFGLMSIVAAGMISRESTTEEDFIRILSSLKEMSAKKSYLSEVCHHVVINLLSRVKGTHHQTLVVEQIKALFFSGPITHVDQLNVVLSLRHVEVDLSEPLKNFKDQAVLNSANLPRLSRIIAQASDGAQEASPDWKPQLHSVWDSLLTIFFEEEQNKEVASFQEFWSVCVDGTLFDISASHGRKFWGFQLVEKVLRRLSAEQIPLIFTPNFMSAFMHHLSSDDKFLYKSARHTAYVIQQVAEENKKVGFALVTQLLGKHGHQSFDRITRTKTVENLLTTMDSEGVKFYLEYLADTIVNASDDTSDACRQWALNQMTLLVTSTKVPKEESWVVEIVQFITICAFFKVKTSDNKKSCLSGLRKPNPDLSEATILYARNQFQIVLMGLLKFSPKDQHAKARRWTGYTDSHELWAHKIYTLLETLKKNKKLTCHLVLRTETEELIKTAIKNASSLSKKIESQDYDCLERGLHILLVHVVIHTWIKEEEGVSILSELLDCYKKIFSDKQRQKKSDELDPLDVIVDILVSFLTNESVVLKNLAEKVFEMISHNLTDQSLKILLDILASVESKQDDELFSENEDDEDTEMVSMDESDSDNEDNDEDDTDVDEELRQKIEIAMQSEGINAVDSESDEEIDDEAMAAFDDKLAEVFRLKKIAKQEKITKQHNVVEFKNRVMSLVSIYSRKNPANPLVLMTIVPLLNVIRSTPAKSTGSQLSEKIAAFLKNRLAKSADYPKDVQGDSAFEALEAVHEFAKHCTSKELSEMCVQLSIYLRKVIFGTGSDFEVTSKLDKKQQASLDKWLTIYSSSCRLYLTKKTTAFPTTMIQQIIQRYPLSSSGLLDTMAPFLDRKACANNYRQKMAAQWTGIILKAKKRTKSSK